MGIPNIYSLFCNIFKFHKNTSINRTTSESELFSRRDKNWTPRINHHSEDTFISCVTKELKLVNSNPNNLSTKERKTPKELSSRDDIIITKAEKGGATVIMNVNDYVDEAKRQLQNTQYYRELNYDPTEDHANIIRNTLEEFKGQLQRFYNLNSYERALKMLKNDMCITEIGQAVLKL